MTLKRPLFMQVGGADTPIEYSAQDVRALLSVLLRSDGILQALSPGISALKVAQRAAGANFSVDVNSGAAAITGDDVADQGFYIVRSTATENLVVPSPPGTGTRAHRVVAQVRDKLHNGAWSDYDWVLSVLEDTGSGTPATPDSALSLATVSVAAGQVSVTDAVITDTRPYALLGSSRFPNVSSEALRPVAPAAGEAIFRTDTKAWELYDGTAWSEIVRTGAWATYTPAWTADSSNPSIGNGTLQGRYRRIGSLIHALIWLKTGSTTTYGSGAYAFSLPPIAARTTTSSLGFHVGSAVMRDNSATNHQDAGCYINTASTLRVIKDNVISPSNPWTWATNDELVAQIAYEAA